MKPAAPDKKILNKAYPTSPFTISEPQNPSIGEFYIIRERRATDFKASYL